MSHAILGIYLHFRKFIFYMKLNFNLTSGIFLFKSVKPRMWSWINAALRCYGHQARVPSCYTNWPGQLCPRGVDSLASPGAGSANSSSLWVAPENYQQAPVCLCLSRHRIGILILPAKQWQPWESIWVLMCRVGNTQSTILNQYRLCKRAVITQSGILKWDVVGSLRLHGELFRHPLDS